jgi:hypothetical protein
MQDPLADPQRMFSQDEMPDEMDDNVPSMGRRHLKVSLLKESALKDLSGPVWDGLDIILPHLVTPLPLPASLFIDNIPPPYFVEI